MSDTLSLSRLYLLIKNHVVENRQRYLLYAIGMLTIGLVIFILVFSMERFYASYYRIENGIVINPNDSTKWEMAQFVIYYAGLFIFGGIFACISFVNFSNSAEAIFYLNKPASHLEKWLTEIVVRVVLFFLVYTLLFYIIDIPATFIARSIEHSNKLRGLDYGSGNEEPGVTKVFHASKIFYFYVAEIDHGIVYGLMISIYLSVIGFFMYGAVLFNSFSFFKTLFLAFVVGMVYFFYGLAIWDSDFLMPGDWDFRFPDRASLDTGVISDGRRDISTGYRASLDDSFPLGVGYLLMLIVPVFLLLCSYFKLKEKEV